MATGTIVGKGLYLEFIPADLTSGVTRVMQVLFTPEGIGESKDYVPFAMHSRTVSESSPRKQWRVTRSPQQNRDIVLGSAGLGSPAEANTFAVEMISRFEKSLSNAVNGGSKWVLRSKPIAVEITSIDLDEVLAYKTPAPALRRIQKCRVALDFPEKLV
jgi:hypothetical protein